MYVTSKKCVHNKVFGFTFLFILCKTVANAKDFKKLGTLEIRILRKKKKISVPCFQSNFEIGKRKNHNDTIFATVSLKNSSFHPHTKATHGRLNIFVCCIIVNKNT
jgi:hypothetical protein